MSTITLNIANIDDPSDPAPLYLRYPMQTAPQSAMIEMDEHGEVSAGTNGEIGNAVPAYVWHGRTLRWDVPAAVRGDALAELLRGDALPLLERVHAGHSVDWDGSNHVGRLDDDAQDASYALQRLIDRDLRDNSACVAVWRVGDWLWSSCSLDQHWSDQPLADVAATLEDEATRDGVMLDGDVAESLLGQAMYYYEDGRPLTATHLGALVAAGRITQDQADEYGQD